MNTYLSLTWNQYDLSILIKWYSIKMKENNQQLLRLLLREEVALRENERSESFNKLVQVKFAIQDFLKEFEYNEIEELLNIERQFIKKDLEACTNSLGMKSSLEIALNELNVAIKLLYKVKDPNIYRLVNDSFLLKQNRRKNIPWDEACQALSSQITRLKNLDKSRLNSFDKMIISLRKKQINHVLNTYRILQAKAIDHKFSQETI